MTQLNELESLRTRVKLLEEQIRSLGHEPIEIPTFNVSELGPKEGELALDEYVRYGRQMILPGFGLPSQLALRNSSILVLGAGGLGCPALMYLASAGTLPVVFAPNVRFHAVLDCTDTPSTRYLLSDVTTRLGIPLISGAAQRTDGQLVVYNLPPSAPLDPRNAKNHTDPTVNATEITNTVGPCMRCIFPSVSRTGAGAERCSDVGVLGPVVGVIGVLMALETIKILTGFGIEECQLHTPSMLLFTGLSPRPFRNIKLRPRQSKCPGCSTGSPQGLPVPELMADLASLQDSYYQYCDVDSHLPNDPILTGARRGEPGMRVKASVLRDALVSAAASSTASPQLLTHDHLQNLVSVPFLGLSITHNFDFNECQYSDAAAGFVNYEINVADEVKLATSLAR
ncbi:adenylyltransferase and sulfurtransferase MOCS3/UBA4 [Rhizoctonia solani]|uniref:Adenylyltransferase and sulfurtransferase MOCS3/UBA4 n=1 Tax=Rhizoctonia solani TaxID=456999 RepID=A0A8H8STF9_9AGAM|nr:adenylyltransferase and sulfurtransferase MOCS3/UBA4 [Rhizoctonia solani]QRW17846.1 adenylyltransferase and sulfurtransferase MOCS3/UBA4 [Rhizoctonia solani]